MYENSALNEYQQVGLESKVSISNSHGLIAMLMEGLLEKLAQAIGSIQRHDTSKQGSLISDGIRIIDVLRASLDHEVGGEISKNLQALYDYMERRLVEANLTAEKEIIDEVMALVTQIKSGWDEIPEHLRSE